MPLARSAGVDRVDSENQDGTTVLVSWTKRFICMRTDLTHRLVGLAAGLVVLVGLAPPSFAGNPRVLPNNTWIHISGVVQSVTADTSLLNYGDGSITVEMDDQDRDAKAYQLDSSDNVVVTGMSDDGFFQMTTFEASSVYVEKLGTYFLAYSCIKLIWFKELASGYAGHPADVWQIF